MTPISRIYFAELWKTFKRPMTWTLAIILIILIVLIYSVLIATVYVPDQGVVQIEGPTEELVDSILLPDGLYLGIGLVQLLVTSLVIVLAAGMVGSELAWGTVRTMLMMGTGRVRFLAGKLLAIITVGFLGIIIGMILTIAGSLATALITGSGLVPGEWLTADFLLEASILAGRTLVGVALWGMIAATVTLVTRSLAAGLGVSMAVFFVGGQIASLLGNLGELGLWLGRAFPNAAIDALMALNSNVPPVYEASDWAWIVGNILAWTVLLATVAVVTFRRMDTLAAGA